MRLFTFENQGTKTYLVYTVKADDAVDTMSLGMITNNSINGLSPALVTQMNMTQYIKYDISAKIPVSQFFMGAVNKKRLIGVFSGIVNALMSSEDYMIDAKNIVLDLDYIFADVSTCETELICLPIMGDNSNVVDLGAFFKNIIFNIQSDQTENCDYVAKIINYLNGTPQFSLINFKKVLDDISRSATSSSNAGEYIIHQDTHTMRNDKPNSTNVGSLNQPRQTVSGQTSLNNVSQQQTYQQHVVYQQDKQQKMTKGQVDQQTVLPPKKEKRIIRNNLARYPTRSQCQCFTYSSTTIKKTLPSIKHRKRQRKHKLIQIPKPQDSRHKDKHKHKIIDSLFPDSKINLLQFPVKRTLLPRCVSSAKPVNCEQLR